LQILVADGRAVQGLFVGAGRDADRITALLGTHATLTGVLPHANMPAVFASADLLAFPAQFETWGNVVLEAKASGLPVLVAADQATARHVTESGVDGLVVPDQSPATWAGAIADLLADDAHHSAMGRAAHTWVQSHALSWADAVAQDLVPVWQSLARPSG